MDDKGEAPSITISKLINKTIDEVDTMIAQSSYNDCLTLTEIKSILRYYKLQKNQAVSLSGCKADLSLNLKTLISKINANFSQMESVPSISTPPTKDSVRNVSNNTGMEVLATNVQANPRVGPFSPSPKRKLEMQSSESTNFGRYSLKTNSLNNPEQYSSPMSTSSNAVTTSQSTSKSHTVSSTNNTNQEIVQQNIIQNQNTNMMTTESESNKTSFMNEIIQNPFLLNIYSELRHSGFSNEQCIYGMEACGEDINNISFDEATVHIISYQEENEYKSDIDRAILASESEREFIQDRKRNRGNDILYDCSVKLSTAEEFKSSLLLGYKDNNTTTNTTNTTATSTKSNTDSTTTTNNTTNKGSEFLKRCMLLCDSFQCKTSTSTNTSTCSCGKEWSSLRRAIASLLLLEKDSIKWWKERSYAYLKLLSIRLDMLPNLNESEEYSSSIIAITSKNNQLEKSRKNSPLKIKNKDNPINKSSTSTTEKESSTIISTKNELIGISKNLGMNIEKILIALNVEIEQLEKALYAMPKHPGAIPQPFIDADPDANVCAIDSLSVEVDGIEIICNT